MRRSVSKTFVSNLPAVMIAVEGGTFKSLYAASLHGRNAVVQGLSGSRSGRTYTVPGTHTTYTASAPGEYPAVMTGQLKGSFRSVVKGDTGYVWTDVDYAEPLEDPKGTGHASARPFMKKILDEESAEMKRICWGAGNPESGRWF